MHRNTQHRSLPSPARTQVAPQHTAPRTHPSCTAHNPQCTNERQQEMVRQGHARRGFGLRLRCAATAQICMLAGTFITSLLACFCTTTLVVSCFGSCAFCVGSLVDPAFCVFAFPLASRCDSGLGRLGREPSPPRVHIHA